MHDSCEGRRRDVSEAGPSTRRARVRVDGNVAGETDERGALQLKLGRRPPQKPPSRSGWRRTALL